MDRFYVKSTLDRFYVKLALDRFYVKLTLDRFYVKSILTDFRRSKTAILAILVALDFEYFAIFDTFECVISQKN